MVGTIPLCAGIETKSDNVKEESIDNVLHLEFSLISAAYVYVEPRLRQSNKLY